MLWQHYVFRRGLDVHTMWDQLFEKRHSPFVHYRSRIRCACTRGNEGFRRECPQSGHKIDEAKLLLVGFSGYHLSPELNEQTEQNATELKETFNSLGQTVDILIGPSAAGEEDISASNALRIGADEVLGHLENQTDIILDASSLPRVAYLALITGLLNRLVPDKAAPDALFANGVNFQIVVGEDAGLDSQIRSEDPSNDPVLIPGFSSALHAETAQDWPLVWFPLLGENRVSQLEKVMASTIPTLAEICPVLPHPSRDPRRADRLLVEYTRPLFDTRETPTTNIMYAHEDHPFEAYRQLLGAMKRYLESLRVIGGCRLVVTPLGSKLITIGAALACFEMRPPAMTENYGIAIPCSQPARYVVSKEILLSAKPEISALLVTGDAYHSQTPSDLND